MGNSHSSDGLPPPGERKAKGCSLLTSAEEIESWLPDSMEKMKKMKPGTVPAEHVEDWEDENVVMKATQVRTRFFSEMHVDVATITNVSALTSVTVRLDSG